MPALPDPRQEKRGGGPSGAATVRGHAATPGGAVCTGHRAAAAAACTVCGKDPGRRGPRRGRCDRCYEKIRGNGHLATLTLAHPPGAAHPWTPPPAWTTQALCAQADPDLWFPEHPSDQACQAAIAICVGCPVRVQCLDYALAIGELDEGVWGGLSPRQRQAEQQRRAAAAAGGSEAA